MVHTGQRLAAARRKALRARHGVPVLMYHLVSDDAPASFRAYTVRPAEFARQVSILSRLGCQTVSPQELLAAHHDGGTLPRRAVVITFDDGFRDCLRHAAPVLHDAGFRATMYLVAGLLGATSRWMAEEGVNLPLLSAAEANELEQAGVECQSHALTHPRLATLPADAIAREMSRSRALLEDKLGHEVRHLAYPHGSYDERVQAQARDAGYLSACTTRPGKALPCDHPMALPRVKVDGRDRTGTFLTRLITGRHVAREVRGMSRALRS